MEAGNLLEKANTTDKAFSIPLQDRSQSGYKRKKKKSPPFVMVRKDLLRNEEWRGLKSSSKVVYIYLRGQFNIETLSEVALPYSKIEDFMSSSTINEAFKELQRKGFIEKVKRGGLYGGATTYKFVGPFKDYYLKGFAV